MDKKIFFTACAVVMCLALIFSGCGNSDPGSTSETSSSGTGNINGTNPPGDESDDSGAEIIEGVKFSKFDLTDTWDEGTAVKINLKGDSFEIDGDDSGIVQDGKKIFIKFEGSYVISGTLNDGQIVVEVSKTEKVQLVLNGADITCSNSAAIHVRSADKTTITLAEGTVNTLNDAGQYIYETEGKTKPNACIYSADDLTINGKGTLNVNAKYNNGIGTKNDLKVISGTVNVNSVNNAVKGVDMVAIKDGILSIQSDDDGIKSDNEVEENRGCVYIFGGTIDIKAGDDSIQAYTKVKITGGKVTVESGGKDVNCGEENVEIADNVLISK